jgi:hypothetical protein
MPICKKCESRFPCKITIEGKRRNLAKRRYCLICSPFGAHNTIQLHITQPPKLERKCDSCQRDYIYEKSKGHKATRCNSCTQSERRKARKRRLVDLKGGQCEKCGYSKSLAGLHFHHKDPTIKEFEIKHVFGMKMDTLLREIEKCSLLCANCHAEEHER